MSSHLRSGRAVRAAAVAAVSLAGIPAVATAASASTTAFTAGDVVVYRVGTGTASLSSAATAVFLDEFAPTGAGQAPALSVPLPTAASGANAALTASGSATSEGLLTRSTDGTSLLVTGYDASPGTTGIASTSSSSVPRVVGVVDGDGNVDTSTTTALYTGNNIRSAASTDGHALWAAGPTNGVIAGTDGTPIATQVTPASGTVNFRQVQIFDGQLYASTGSGSTHGIDTIGTGTPSGSNAGPATVVPGLDSGGSTDPYGFLLLSQSGGSTPDTAYVADNTAGEVLKYVLVGGAWTAEGEVTGLSGVTGLTGSVVGGAAQLFAATPSKLVTLTDTGGSGTLTGAVTVLATAPANEAFRGVAFAPQAPPPASTPEAPVTIGLPAGAFAIFGIGALVRTRRSRRRAQPAS